MLKHGHIAVETVTIESGASLSSALNMQTGNTMLAGMRLFGIIMPAAWTTANLSFLVSFDGGTTWVPLKSMYDGSVVTCVVNADGYFPLPDPRLLSAVTHLKIQSGTPDAPVVQGAERTLTLILRGI